jgi:hypothetical protein
MTIRNFDDLKIVYVPVSNLKPSEYNPRKHTKEQAEQLKESIIRFGMVDPIVCNGSNERKNVVIGGHFRLEVARELKHKTVPVVYVHIDNLEREKELNLRLNKNTGEFDLDMLVESDEHFRKSGNWYQGRHEPLITKELFDLVQEQLKGNELKTRQEKEFAFTRMMMCGLCGSGISADEKYKKLKSGKINPHIYYGCTKSRDKNCKCGYINETDLIKQLQKLVDTADLNETSVMKKIKDEVARYKKFHRMLLGEKAETDASDIDTKSYVKFLLKDGTVEEKRAVMSCFNSQIVLKNKEISLQARS